ncbi:Immunoglobulin I-set domain containing protein 3 [Sarcoptes scabiei]|uniref:Immunoglobulin I-set domain containing protein 3 n=1 Tax=Sarcoptes scabiei TaxID=52283 RepID=A0A131ZXX1_SARSC|nr:Immunoglobulin I-set domain containing protein 3 [Sarcoptes scabiei]
MCFYWPQPCTNKFDFRQIQCQAYNNKPYRDRYYEWQAFLDPTNPCSLTCQAKGLNFVAKLASHVIDGTRCTADSLAICVAGKCMNVGCDLQIGSTKKIDRCGVCGGDGTSCHNHSYSWSHRFYSNCSRRCGGGQQSSTVVCFDEINDLIVDDHYCTTNLKVKKPHHLVHDCNEFDCKPSWITEQWSNCSKSCGTGRQTRIAYCAIEQDDPSGSIKIKIDDHECDLVKKPEFERECRRNDCPQWFEGSWSECSVKCGEGRQQREVVCKDNQGFASDECDQALKPSTERKCFSNQNCFVNIYPQNDDQNDRSLTNSIGKRLLKIEPKSIPSYKIGEWSKCNVTCGLGHRSRNVSCRMYLEFSKTFAEIPMKECPGIEPLSIETCYGFDCDQQTNTTTTSTTFLPDEFGKGSEEYYWSVIGFTECSHECLGGIQDSIIECIKSENSMTMPSFYCDSKLKPPISYQICNDFPCTPRWNLSDFGKCSKKCGEGGIQTRTVACIHEIIKEPSTTIIVDDSNCPSPKPSVKQKCNQIDCSAKWIADPWQKCSKPCDGGMKKRNVYCVKDFVHGGLQNVSLSDCHAKKPKVIKMCNLRPCRLVPNSEVVRKSKRNYFGSDHRSSSKQSFGKQTYKVQGKIVVHEGSRIRLICPEWSSNLNVRWFKGQEPISEEPSNRIIIAENVLKIRNINLKDIGVYKCIYSDDTENSMFLQVMPKKTMPISFFNKDELDDQINPTKPILDKTFSQTKSLNFIDDFSAMEFDRHSNSSWPEALNSKFNWISTGWSNCTIPCGGFGFKMIVLFFSSKIRKSQCYAQTGNMTRLINDSYCLNSGLEKPKQFETCGLDSCYNWVVGNWSKCDDCVDLNKGLQKRSVICQSWNGSESNDSNCFQWVDKPIQQQECYLSDCIPKLQSNFLCQKRTDEQCGRLISCVWQRNGKTIDDSFCDETIISDKK